MSVYVCATSARQHRLSLRRPPPDRQGATPIHWLVPAPVAQGIERAPPEREVAGSNPAGRMTRSVAPLRRRTRASSGSCSSPRAPGRFRWSSSFTAATGKAQLRPLADDGSLRRPRRARARGVEPRVPARWVAAAAGRRPSWTSLRVSTSSPSSTRRSISSRVVAVGHSAGGHLALWAASRPTLPADAPGADPRVAIGAAVSQAGLLDLTPRSRSHRRRPTPTRALLGDPAVTLRALRARVAARASAARRPAARAPRRP